MKTLTAIFKPFYPVFFLFVTLLVSNAASAQGRHKREISGDKPVIERRNTPGNFNRSNPVLQRQHPVNTTNRPSRVITARPGINTPRSSITTNRRPVITTGRPVVYGTMQRPAYRPVYGYGRPVYSAVNPGWRYGYLPRRNAYYSYLPSTYLTINFGGFGYRYWNGVFYRPYNNLFTVIAPPPGIFINVLPVGYRTVYVRNYPYYYYNGTYYDKRDNNYYVVSPPIGSVVESLPAGYETVTIEGETYYTIDGAQYKPVIKENGEIWYEVIKAN